MGPWVPRDPWVPTDPGGGEGERGGGSDRSQRFGNKNDLKLLDMERKGRGGVRQGNNMFTGRPSHFVLM